MNLMRQALLESIETAIQPIIDESRLLPQPKMQQLAQQCADALVRLRQTVEVRDLLDSNQPVPEALTKCVSINKVSNMQLLTCDEMLEAVMLENESQSLQSILIELKRFQEIKDILDHNYPVDCRLSTITTEELCQLTVAGNFNAIKNAYISSFRINQLVSWAVNSGPATYMGTYNALMLAVAHRQVDIVKYFAEMQGVKLDIKGGRKSDLTVRNCADKLSVMFSAVNSELVTYLDNKLLEKPKRTYRDALLHTFLKPPVMERTPEVSPLNGFANTL